MMRPRLRSFEAALLVGYSKSTVLPVMPSTLFERMPTPPLLTHNNREFVDFQRSNEVDQKAETFRTVEQFLSKYAKNSAFARPIKTLLIANNGMAASKCVMSIRRWAQETFKDDRLFKFINLTTEQEIASNPEYLKMIDNFVFSESGANENNYANVDDILQHAVNNKVDAVWAGWGHASENPDLPNGLKKHNIAFMGPSGPAMFTLGDKIASTILAQSAGVPVVPWSGSDVYLPKEQISRGRSDVEVPQELRSAACVLDHEEAIRVIKEKKIPYPIMVKASEGGGGKGIRLVRNESELEVNFRRVQAEVAGGHVFLMHCLEGARHIEVQLLGDMYGQVISLRTRDCSVQRRCQKIIEEAPAIAAPSSVQNRMEADAVRLAKMVGYVSAGTVEYLYLPGTKKYYFLELNPRLQVEHPLSEMLTNVNLPAAQLQIAMGLPLHCISEIRLYYGESRYGDSEIPFDEMYPKYDNHVVSVRITSEDPDENFRPASGEIINLNFRSTQFVWGYFSYVGAGSLHEFADSQFGHLFATGSNRSRHLAISNMLNALQELQLQSKFPVTLPYLISLFKDSDFEQNLIDTTWLDRRIASKKHDVESPPPDMAVALGAMLIAHSRITEAFSAFTNAISRGRILQPSDLTETHQVDLIYRAVKYSVTATRTSNCEYMIKMNGCCVPVEYRELRNGTLLLKYKDRSHPCYLEEESERYKVHIGRMQVIFDKENDPTVLRSSCAGKLLTYEKEDGEILEPDDVYATMESMKVVLEMRVKKFGGRFKRVALIGQMLHPGTLVARLDAENGFAMTEPEECEQPFVEWTEIVPRPSTVLVSFADVVQEIHNVFDGFCKTEPTFPEYADGLVEVLFAVLSDKTLPFEMMHQKLGVMKYRLRPDIMRKLKSYADQYGEEFPVHDIKQTVTQYLNDLEPQKKREENMVLDPINRMISRFENGKLGHTTVVLKELLGHYYEIEEFFQDSQYDKCVTKILSQVKDPERCVRMICSHTKIQEKNMLAKKLLYRINNNQELVRELSPVLDRIAKLVKNENSALVHVARTLLIEAETPTYIDIKVIGLFETFATSFESVEKYVTAYCGVPNDAIKRLEVVGGHANDVQFPIRIQKIAHGLGLPNDKVEEITIVMRVMTDLVDLANRVPQVAAKISKPNTTLYVVTSVPNLHKTLKCDQCMGMEKRCDANIDEILSLRIKDVIKAVQNPNIRQVVVLISSTDLYPLFFYFDMKSKEEIRSQRNIDLAHLPKLGLHRIKENYNIVKLRSPHNAGHLYKAEGKSDTSEQRFFYRAVVCVLDSYTSEEVTCSVTKALERACNEISVALYNSDTGGRNHLIDRNHILLFIHRAPSTRQIRMTPDDWSNVIYKAYRKCKESLWRSRVNQVEVDFILYGETRNLEQATKVVITDDTGFTPLIKVLLAKASSGTSSKKKWLHEEAAMSGFKHGLEIMVDSRRNPDWNPFIDPYFGRTEIDKRRLKAHLLKTTYVYDYSLLFQRAVVARWLAPERCQKKVGISIPNEPCQFYELVLDEETGKLIEMPAAGTLSTIGMVAWRVRLIVPEYSRGRDVIVIANDISHQIGSFSMREHRLYYEASKLSREKGLPRIYIAANSGARIGISPDIIKLFGVKWKCEDNPTEGFEGLYLSDEDLRKVDGIVSTYRKDNLNYLEGIIGKERDLGVENLVGSGLIAGETSRAYNDVVTYCLVTGRTVGIGAYVARLSRRICQVENADIILTGAPALNSVLGREVYTSNGQLGGTEIMTKNGVTHASASNDYEGVCQLLVWLSHTRETVKAPFRQHKYTDPIERPVSYDLALNKENDPRLMIKGTDEKDGLFDKDSFDEIKPDWGKTVITGRARLGGISVGVIAVETRTVFAEIPADPAAPDSQVKCVQQAGQVWYPDSAYKTAEAIEDFNKEALPLFILANWRGFSGGQKDMFEMVLKFGAYVVDQLCKYLHPVIVYIPPHGELRGGAWAVVDPSINPACMHMYADPRSRGGVLEPEGTVQVKLRKELVPMMRRLDHEMMRLSSLKRCEETSKMEEARINLLMPTYRNLAIKFADLHDTPVRMKAVGAITDIVKWEESRAFFAKRLLRLCTERDIFQEAGEIKYPEDLCKMRGALERYFKARKCTWENVPDSEAISVLRLKRKEIVSSLSANEFDISNFGKLVGIPQKYLEDFTKKCDALIRGMREERL